MGNHPKCKELNKFLSRVYFVHQKQAFFLYMYTLFRYRRNRSHRSENEENAFLERFSIGFAPMNMRPSGRWSGLSNDPNEFEAWYAHVRVRTEPRGALIERITQRGKDIYKLAFFASIRINKSSRGTNALRAYLYVREIERISTVLPCFPPRALPLRSQISGKSSEIFINLKESYNIYKIIFYSKIYFIIFCQ